MTSHDPVEPSAPDADADVGPRVWREWPCCPDCDRRRRVECPICGVSGTHIPLADPWGDIEPIRETRTSPASDSAAALDDSRVLLLCECCDEPYRPRFFRYCESCGHDFGAGIERSGDPLPIGPRAIWTAAAMAGIVTGLMAWFSYVLNQ